MSRNSNRTDKDAQDVNERNEEIAKGANTTLTPEEVMARCEAMLLQVEEKQNRLVEATSTFREIFGTSDQNIGESGRRLQGLQNAPISLRGPQASGRLQTIKRGDAVIYRARQGGDGTYFGGWFKVNFDSVEDAKKLINKDDCMISIVSIPPGVELTYDTGIGISRHKLRTRRYIYLTKRHGVIVDHRNSNGEPQPEVIPVEEFRQTGMVPRVAGGGPIF